MTRLQAIVLTVLATILVAGTVAFGILRLYQ
jgi:hypothetical protein